jgi:pimeloyl-ACP methyl ester carboxylesterase
MASRHKHASRVVILHGRAAAMDIPATFEADWVAAARYGLQRVDYEHATCVPIEMAFYGKVWRPDQHTVTPTFDAGLGERAFLGLGLPDFGRRIEELGEWADARFGISGRVLAWMLDDTKEYFERADLRAETNAIVDAACKGPGEVVLVGFSMGSLVAHNVLAWKDATYPVRSLVTCGSPIGDPEFHRRVAAIAPNGEATFPAPLRMWANIWNDDDPATRVHDLTRLFPGPHPIQAEPTRGRGPSPLNPAAAHNGMDYLSSKALAAAVRTALAAAG